MPGRITTALVHFHRKDERHNVTLRLIRPADEFDRYQTRTEVLAQNSVTIDGMLTIFVTIFVISSLLTNEYDINYAGGNL